MVRSVRLAAQPRYKDTIQDYPKRYILRHYCDVWNKDLRETAAGTAQGIASAPRTVHPFLRAPGKRKSFPDPESLKRPTKKQKFDPIKLIFPLPFNITYAMRIRTPRQWRPPGEQTRTLATRSLYRETRPTTLRGPREYEPVTSLTWYVCCWSGESAMSGARRDCLTVSTSIATPPLWWESNYKVNWWILC